MMKIYLASLNHKTLIHTNNFVPLSIGYIASYVDKNTHSACKIKLFNDPDQLISAIKKSPPDILGFSCYSWSASISSLIAKNFKKNHPKRIVVFGGPSFPTNEIPKAEKQLQEWPFLDFYVPFEGERPLLSIVLNYAQQKENIKKLKTTSPELFEGSYFLRNDSFFGQNIGLKIEQLDEIPAWFKNK